jgi:hypothetical protein
MGLSILKTLAMVALVAIRVPDRDDRGVSTDPCAMPAVIGAVRGAS